MDVYVSNVFAILGFRALYFALAAMIRRFTYLRYALGLVLGGVTMGLLPGGVLCSLYRTRGSPEAAR